MSKITILHNPRCSKSRNALAYLEEKGLELNVVKYLVDTPSKEELIKIIEMLNITPRQLMRTKEDIYKELNLKDAKSDEVLITAMIENPKLIERPIIIKDNKAVIARPLENIDKIL
ncbi:arsenate reductase (glutaredoxin) [Halarcobacter sp.]|uniref:arsenate reductase (glutaredoxin) n=1 Tax=Halarcobacter sp. TaxID=2321133 RepID=UPI002AAAE346|nr:arsenate reductase (glutaredoxin) [Halarcobacter sp.]